MDNVSILKADLGESAADLSAKFNSIDRGKLPEKAEPDIEPAAPRAR